MTTNFDAAPAFRAKGYNVMPLKAVDVLHAGIIFGGDHDDEPGQLHKGDGLNEAAHAEVTAKFCRADRTTPLSQQEGRHSGRSCAATPTTPARSRSDRKLPLAWGGRRERLRTRRSGDRKHPALALFAGVSIKMESPRPSQMA
jgi:hypothetical protein